MIVSELSNHIHTTLTSILGWFCVALFFTHSAWASERAHVTVVSPDETPLTLQIVDELRLGGYDVALAAERPVLPPPSSVDPDPIQARAILLMQADHIKIEIVDRATTKTTIRLPLEPNVHPRVAAIHAVEALRAGLIELQELGFSRDVEVGPPVLIKPTKESVSSWAVAIGPSATWTPGGIGFNKSLGLRVYYDFRSFWSVVLHGEIPIDSNEIDGGLQGMTTIWRGWLTADLEALLFEISDSFSVRGGAGVGAAWTWTEENAGVAVGENTQGLSTTVITHGFVGCELSLHRRIAIRTDVYVGAVLPEQVAQAGDSQVAAWTTPIVSSSATLTVALD